MVVAKNPLPRFASYCEYRTGCKRKRKKINFFSFFLHLLLCLLMSCFTNFPVVNILAFAFAFVFAFAFAFAFALGS